MSTAGFGIRGTFLDFIDDPWKHVGQEEEAARFHADGLLVVEDGKIVDFGNHSKVAPRHRGLAITEIRDRLIVPGFIDGHIHFPQTRPAYREPVYDDRDYDRNDRDDDRHDRLDQQVRGREAPAGQVRAHLRIA